MNLDFKNINITMTEDWKVLKREWEYYFDGEYAFEPYQELLSKLNIIVGFGRGFWSGTHGYFYLVFHKDTQKFYWYLRDIESDDKVFFYEIEENSEIFSLLNSKSIDGHFDEFDSVLDFKTLHPLSIGNTENMKDGFKMATLTELFGEDTKRLRMALMYFSPASQGSHYPHGEFHKQYFLPKQRDELEVQARAYNEGTFHVFREDNNLYIQLNEDVFKLVKES